MRDRSLRDPLMWGGCALYAIVFFALGAVRYGAHRNYVDLGIFAQTAVSAFGCFCDTVEGSHYAFHFSPILYVAGALMQMWKSPLALVALQAAAGALTIPPVYGLVARRAERATARLTAAVVFLYPPLAGLIFNDFHENGMAPAAVAWLLWSFDGGFTVATLAATVVTLAIKEDQAAFLAIAGGLGTWRFRGTTAGRTALVVAVVGVSVFIEYFRHIQPHAAAVSPHWMPVRFYAWTPADVHALFFAGIGARLGFIVLAFLPLLFVPFRSRMMWLAAAPLAEVLLSRMSTTFTIGSHYAGAWAGYVLAAFAFAIARMPDRRARTVLIACLALCVLEFAVANPLHPKLTLRTRTAADRRLDAFLKTLPADSQIATQEEAFTHLAAIDPQATLLPESSAATVTSCLLLTDGDFPNSPRLVEAAQLIARLRRSGAYRIVRRSGAITLYRSAACRAEAR
ncbi:MAG: DUF2079 domain-containing protein [Candidatus Eremiobacteraeota bacterium]|nr:DUF2079 domain-containing protein [Candidatus Eremiobacteraeota bacterium]